MFSLPLRDGACLRPLELRHAEQFATHLDRAREHIRPWVGAGFVTEGVDGARGTLLRYAERQAADGARLFGIWSADDTLVGGVMFTAFDAAGGACEVGCWLEPAAEGHGLVTEACMVLLDWALTDRGLHRAEWHCRADNERSAAVARRLGMTLEGVRREAWPFGGVRHDKQVWAVLAPEWRAHRGQTAPSQ
ncbi:GNAT family N-acetyltransferase [Streptomyces sp. NBC_00555]|uniref:GNAT family N-acetyltransferase n=1 Tax=Streptomyces sp. NBC_00555 TaxID=2903662 RepID=UPI002258F921|nr:GNAT family protein [Streptomyces sp. NBC_00555]MCX5009777.1 GNAT family N-acetyltransferase [Streptomyces sp. NBC_00555]